MKESTKEFVLKNWTKIPPEVLVHYVTNLRVPEIVELIPGYLKQRLQEFDFEGDLRMELDNQIIDDAIDYIWKFGLYDIDINWLPIIIS